MIAEGLEFTDWANQETKHHGKTSLKDWADHEIKTHGGKMSFQDWAKHEDKSHIRRYGAEEGCPKCGDVEDYFINECCDTPNCFYCGNECYIRVNKVGSPIKEDHVVNCTEHQCCIEFMGGSRLYGAEARVSDLDEDEDLLPVGTKVRSYDFWPNDSSYIEGVIEKIAPSPRCSPDCMHYHIRTTKTVRQGKEINENAIGEIFMTHPYEDFGWTLKRAKHIQVIVKKSIVRDAEELKKDSCCCGATKSKPCACMIQGVMECSATCPCALEN